MAFLKNIALSLTTKILPNVVENLFPATKDIVRKFKDETHKSKELLGGVKNDVKTTINQFEGVNPTYRRLMKQVKTGKFGLNADDLSAIEDKANGFDFSGLDDMGDFNTDFDTPAASESSETTDMLGGIYHGVTGVSDGDAIVSGQMNQSISMTRNIGMETINILASVNKNIALMAAFQSEQTKEYYDASLDFFRVSSSFQTEMSTGYALIFEKYADDKRNREIATRNSRNEHADASDVFNFSSAIEKVISKTNVGMLFGENSIFSDDINKFNEDPLGTLAEMGITTMMDAVFKRPIEAVNTFLEDLPFKMNTMFDEWSNDGAGDIFGGMKRFVGGLFKINLDTDKKITGGKFLDGPVDFDGKVHFAITDVIPMYLRKILQGIRNTNEIWMTGAPTTKDEIIFDYSSGKLVGSDKVLKDLKDDVAKIKEQPYAHFDTMGKVEDEVKKRNKAIEDRNTAALSADPSATLEDLLPELTYSQQKALTANIRQLYEDNNGKVNKTDIASMDYHKIKDDGTFELDAAGNKIKDVDLKNTFDKLTATLDDVMDVTARLASDTVKKRHTVSEGLNTLQNRVMGTSTNSALMGDETNINDIESLPLNWGTMTDAEKIRQIKDYPNAYSYKENGKTWKVETGSTPGSEILVQRRRGGIINDPGASLNNSRVAPRGEVLVHRRQGGPILDPSVNIEELGTGPVVAPRGEVLVHRRQGGPILDPSVNIEDPGASLNNSRVAPRGEVLVHRRQGGPILDPSVNIEELGTGPVVGPGTGTSDSILARVSNGEFVIKANMAKRYGEILEKINNGTYREQFNSGVDALHKKLQDKVGYEEDGSAIPITWDNLKDVVATTVSETADKYVIDPMKNAFKKTADNLQKTLFDPMKKSITSTLIGTTGMKDKEGSEKLGLADAFKLSLEENILEPFKLKLLGDEKYADKTKDGATVGIFASIKEFTSDKVLEPLKLKLLGPEKYADKTKDGAKVGIVAAIKSYTDESILDPFKRKLLGEDRYNELTKDGKKLGIFGTIMDYTHTNILTPMKQFLLGDERHAELTKGGKKVSMFSAIRESFAKKIIDPLKTLMVGSDTRDYIKGANNGEDFSLWQYAKVGINERILEPLKNLLVGGEEKRSKDEKKDTIWNYTTDRLSKTTESFKRLIVGDDRYNELSNKKGKRLGLVASMFTAYNERILEPLKGWVFGAENKKGNLFKLMFTKTSEFFNKLIFGFEKANQGNLFKNLLDVTKKAVTSLTGDIGKYTLNIFRDRYMPIMKDFLKEGSSYLIEKLNIFKGGFALEFKNLAIGLLGDKNIERLRKFIVEPLQNAMSKLTKAFTWGFQNLLKLPAMGLEKVTDSIKRSRMKSGKATYDADETKRLLENKSRFGSWETGAILNREGRLKIKADRTKFGSSKPEDVTALNTQRTAESTKRIEELMQQQLENDKKIEELMTEQLDNTKALEQTMIDIDAGNDSAEEKGVKKHEAKQAHDAKQAALAAALEARKAANRKTDTIEGGVQTAEEAARAARDGNDGTDSIANNILNGANGGIIQGMMALGVMGILKKLAGFIFKLPMAAVSKVASAAFGATGLLARGGAAVLGGTASMATRGAAGASAMGTGLLNTMSGTGPDGPLTGQQLRDRDAHVMNDMSAKKAERDALRSKEAATTAERDALNDKVTERSNRLDELKKRDPNSLTEREEREMKVHEKRLERDSKRLGGINTNLENDKNRANELDNHLNDEGNKAALARSSERVDGRNSVTADAVKAREEHDRAAAAAREADNAHKAEKARIDKLKSEGKPISARDQHIYDTSIKNKEHAERQASDAEKLRNDRERAANNYTADEDRLADERNERRDKMKGAGLGGLALMGGEMVGTAIGGDLGAHISGITGYMGMGAMLGSIAGPIGTAAGAAAGGLLYLFTEPSAMAEMSKLADGAMSFMDQLPDKIQAFTDKIPEKIGEFFGMNQDPATIEFDAEGNPINLKPNLLSMIGGLFFRIQGMLMGIAPKILGAAYSLIAGGLTSLAIGAVSGISNLVLSIFDTVTSAIMGIKHFVIDQRAKLPDFVPFSLTTSEAAKIKADDINEMNQSQATRRKDWNMFFIEMQKSAGQVVNEQSKSISNLGADRAKAVAGFGKELMGGDNRDIAKEVKPDSKLAESGQTGDGSETKPLATKAKNLASSAIDKFNELTDRNSNATDAAGNKLNTDISKYTNKSDATLDINGAASARAGTSSADVNEAIHIAAGSNEAQSLGISEDTLHALAMLESSKNPLAKSPGKGTFKGLYQIGPDVAAHYGISGKEFDPYSNTSTAVKYMRDNAVILRKKGIPVSGTSLYLAHQQGASGFSDIYSSAVKGTPMSDTRIKLMLNNVPPNSGITNPVDYIKYYNARIAAGGRAFNTKEIAALINGGNVNLASTPLKPSTAETVAKNTVTPSSDVANNNPNTASKTPTVVASKKDTLNTDTAKAMEDTIKTSSAQNTNAAQATKQALLPNSAPETGIVDELRKQSTILERIASNTKEVPKINLFNGVTKEEEAKKIKEITGKSNNPNSSQINFNTEDDIMRPGNNTLALARGMSV